MDKPAVQPLISKEQLLVLNLQQSKILKFLASSRHRQCIYEVFVLAADLQEI